MKHLFVAVLTGVLLAATVHAAPTEQPTVVAFVNVTVIPMDSERVLEGQTVLVEGDRIVAVGAAGEVAVPDGALTIDGRGKYLMPGLAEMHGHIPDLNPSPQFVTNALGSVDPQAYIDNVLFLYVANGITTVRGMLGWPGQLTLREQANTGRIVAPTLYLAGPSFNGNSIQSPEEAVAKVKAQKAEGWNLLKIHPGLTVAEYDAMAETAHAEGIRFGGHVPADVGLMHALEMGQETFDHLDGYVEYLATFNPDAVDEAALAEAVRRTKDAGAWVVPTMALWEVLYGTRALDDLRAYPELQYMPPRMVQGWIDNYRQRLNSPQFNPDDAQDVIRARMRVLEALHEGGVDILMGTDAPQLFSIPGFSLHRELDIMAAAGMPPYEIIKSGSASVGAYFADEDAFGTIAPGQRADLLLVNANPLEDVGHIRQRSGVMVRGRWLGEADIQARLAEIAAAYRQADN